MLRSPLSPSLRPALSATGNNARRRAAPAVPLVKIYEGQIATRTYYPSNLTAAHTQVMARSFHIASDSITSLKLVFQDAYGSSEAGTGANTTIEAAIEYPEGVYTRVAFAAADTGVMASGAMMVSDSVSVTIPEGAVFWVRQYRLNPNGFIYNLYAGINAAQGDRSEAGASVENKVMGGSIASNQSMIATPSAIVGMTRKPSVYLLGDSRVIGVDDDFGDNALGATGEFARSISWLAYINAGFAGDRASSFVSANSKRLGIAAYCSHLVCNYGINDITGGATEATAKTSLLTLWGILRNNKNALFHSTLPPITTSSDGWATVENQTLAATNTIRVNVNNFIRTVPDVLDGVFEFADVAESARDSGLWKPGYTSDGVHENETGYVAIVTSEAINPALFVQPVDDTSFTEAQKVFAEFTTPPDAGTVAAYTTLIDDLKTAGVWEKLDILYVLAAPDDQAARINLISPKKFRASRINTLAHAANDGFTGNGTNSELMTNWIPSRDAVNYTQNSASIFVYCNDDVRANTVLCGYAGSGNKAYINPRNSSQDTMGLGLNSSALVNGIVPGGNNGLFVLSRTASTGFEAYRNGALRGTQTSASTAVPVSALRVCSGGGIYYDSTRTASIFGAGGGLTSGEVAAMSTAVSNFMTAIS